MKKHSKFVIECKFTLINFEEIIFSLLFQNYLAKILEDLHQMVAHVQILCVKFLMLLPEP